MGSKTGQMSRNQAQGDLEGKAEWLGHCYTFALWVGKKGHQGQSLINASPQAPSTERVSHPGDLYVN